MNMTLQAVENLIGEFAIIFPVPNTPDADGFCRIWLSVLDRYEIEEVRAAYQRLMRKLIRFPFPADVVTEINLINEEARLAAEAAAQK